MIAFSIQQKRFIVTGLLVLFSLGFLGFFQESSRVNPVFQSFIVSLVFFLVIPILYCKLVLKEPLKNLGWQKGSLETGVLSGIFAVALGAALIFFLSQYFSLRENYVFPAIVETNFWWFVAYEVLLVSFVALLYEVFFRGFIQFLWLGHLGLWAVFIQAGIFIGLFFLSNDFSWQKAPILIFSPLAGLVAYYSRSLWYSWAASCFFLFLTDVFLLMFYS